MSDQFQTERFDENTDRFRSSEPPPERGSFKPLPGWLAQRFLQPGEVVEWVQGPSFTPSWELTVTHPALFLAALPFVVITMAIGWVNGERLGEMRYITILIAGAIFFTPIFVLGIACGHFTRLVVTNKRLLILQGREIVRSWFLDDLPGSLLRYRGTRNSTDDRPTVDLDALKTMLGTSPDQVVDAKTIMSLGKKLDQIRLDDRRRQ